MNETVLELLRFHLQRCEGELQGDLAYRAEHEAIMERLDKNIAENRQKIADLKEALEAERVVA